MTGSTFHTFPAVDELPHEVGEHPMWQESVFLTWGDRERGVFGFHRIGQEVNANGGAGLVTAWNGITTREGTRFRRYVLEELRPEDRHDRGFKASDGFSMDHDGTQTRWRIDDPDCSMDLTATDYTPRFDLYKDGGSVVDNFAAGHIEVGSAIRGTVRLGDRHYDIDGLAYRDHSWGKRDRSTMLSHRWIAGTVGPELTFNATAWHGTDGSLRTYGIVCRNGEVSYARSVDIVVYVEIDAISHRGGLLRLELEDGELIEISAKLIDGFLTQHHNTGCVDTLCEVEWNGLRGFCDLEMSTNPRAGTGPISGLVRAGNQNGLSTRDWTLTHEGPNGLIATVGVR
jgi:hypothetical protein